MIKEGENSTPDWWMKLDNAAKIYPAITGSELTGVFRISVYLTTPVKLPALVKATEETAAVFPLFSVELCKGFSGITLNIMVSRRECLPTAASAVSPSPGH